jgi:hypothetical protein
MSTTHTPGPWLYEPETETIRSVKENYWLASMESFEGEVSNEANARLIASAPELLEALRALHEYTRALSAGYRNALTEAEDELYTQVSAAIAKATTPNA